MSFSSSDPSTPAAGREQRFRALTPLEVLDLRIASNYEHYGSTSKEQMLIDLQFLRSALPASEGLVRSPIPVGGLRDAISAAFEQPTLVNLEQVAIAAQREYREMTAASAEGREQAHQVEIERQRSIIASFEKLAELTKDAKMFTPSAIAAIHEQFLDYLSAPPPALQEAGAAPASAWQPIETAPERRKVIVSWVNVLGKRRTTFATFWPVGTLNMADGVPDDYIDEEGRNTEAGWWEESEANDEEMWRLNEPLTHWMPMPQAPKDVK